MTAAVTLGAVAVAMQQPLMIYTAVAHLHERPAWPPTAMNLVQARAALVHSAAG